MDSCHRRVARSTIRERSILSRAGADLSTPNVGRSAICLAAGVVRTVRAGGPNPLVALPGLLSASVVGSRRIPPGWHNDGGERVSGVELSQLEPNTLLDLPTAGPRYRVVVCDPVRGEVLIQGGRCCSRYTAVRLSGAGIGVNPVKTSWIGLGLGIEIVWDDLRIITAPVQSIRRRVRPAPLGLADRAAP